MAQTKPTHLLVLFAYGEHFWTQLTVLSFLSAQNRLSDNIEVPKFRTVVVTDKARSIKAYFGTWVEVLSIDKGRLEALGNSQNGHFLFKLGLLCDLVIGRQVKVLSLESDVYFNLSPLSAFNHIDKGKMVFGEENKHGFDKAVLGFGPENVKAFQQVISHLEKSTDDHSDLQKAWLPADRMVHVRDYYHYRKELTESVGRIEKFFERHYYRDMGELFTMAGLWTPDKWHLEADDLPEELI